MGLVLGVWELCHQGRTVGVVLDVGEQLHQGRTCHQREMEHQCGDGVMHFVYLVAAFHQCIFEKIEQIIFHLFLELSFPLHGITHAEPLQPLLQQILALLWSWPFANPIHSKIFLDPNAEIGIIVASLQKHNIQRYFGILQTQRGEYQPLLC